MKWLYLAIFFLNGIICKGQLDTISNSYESSLYRFENLKELANPNFQEDSLEIRCWISSHSFSDLFVQLKVSKKGRFQFNRGYINYDLDSVIILNDFKNSRNDSLFWSSLISNDIMELPDQKKAEIIVIKDNDQIRNLIFSEKQKIIDSFRGDFVLFEIFQSTDYRKYGYSSPSKIYSACISNNFKCPEYEKVNNLVWSFFTYFELIDVLKLQMQSRLKD